MLFRSLKHRSGLESELGPAFVSGGSKTYDESSPDSEVADSGSDRAGGGRKDDKNQGKDKLELLFDSLDLDLESDGTRFSSLSLGEKRLIRHLQISNPPPPHPKKNKTGPS